MSWQLSQFRTGDLVEVRSKEEILATLDKDGCKEGMPFMPEMLQFCGRRFRVGAIAHKTCETAHQTWKARRLNSTVHLSGLRCDGSAHGGCQADCNLFWKDAWLKSAEVKNHNVRAAKSLGGVGELTEPMLQASVVQSDGEDELRYSCQATRLYDATTALASWDPRQYWRDVLTGNHPVTRVLRVFWLAWLKYWVDHTPIGYRATTWIRKWMHRRLTGCDVPDFIGTIPRGEATPAGRLHLAAGTLVRIKSKDEIMRTVDEVGVNRGLRFDKEMSPYCGQVARVRASVDRIIDELTGRMRYMKQPCVILEGVVCKGEHSEGRLLCPRAIPSYWREIWLERIDESTLRGSIQSTDFECVEEKART